MDLQSCWVQAPALRGNLQSKSAYAIMLLGKKRLRYILIAQTQTNPPDRAPAQSRGFSLPCILLFFHCCPFCIFGNKRIACCLSLPKYSSIKAVDCFFRVRYIVFRYSVRKNIRGCYRSLYQNTVQQITDQQKRSGSRWSSPRSNEDSRGPSRRRRRRSHRPSCPRRPAKARPPD